MNQTSTVVVLFADVVESTALMTAIGDDDADRVRRELFARARSNIESCRGTLVKTYGDGLMAVFPAGVGDAVRCAENLRDVARTIESPRQLRLRIGIAAGEASEEDGDWFGTPVVEASRLCTAADPDEVLLSETARQLIGSRGSHEFTAVGRLTLKGLAQPLPTYALGNKARKRPHPRGRRWVAAALALTLVSARGGAFALTSGGESAETSAPPLGKPKGYSPRLVDRACTEDEAAGDRTVTCQTLVVPEDREHPDNGRRVELPVIHAPATSADASKVPVISVGSRLSSPAGAPLRAAAPQIGLGVRGRTGTPSLSCTELDQSRTARLQMPWRDAQSVEAADLHTCLDRLQAAGIALRAYDDADVADDIRDLVLALGSDHVMLRTGAGDARAASAALRRFPVILDGVMLTNPTVPPAQSLVNVPIHADQSLATLQDRCKASAACNALFNGRSISAAVDATREQLRAQPQLVTVAGHDVLMDDGRLMQALHLGL